MRSIMESEEEAGDTDTKEEDEGLKRETVTMGMGSWRQKTLVSWTSFPFRLQRSRYTFPPFVPTRKRREVRDLQTAEIEDVKQKDEMDSFIVVSLVKVYFEAVEAEKMDSNRSI